MVVENIDGSIRPLTELISEAGIIINGIFQDTKKTTDFITKAENKCLKPNSLIIDVSCDEEMGFFFCQTHYIQKPNVQALKH